MKKPIKLADLQENKLEIERNKKIMAKPMEPKSTYLHWMLLK